MRPRIPRIIPVDAPARRRFLAGGLAAIALTATVGTAAFAQTATPTPSSGRPAIVKPDQSAFLNALAARLNVSAADLQTALKAAQKEIVAQDLAAGRITQEQATQINQRIDQSTGFGFFGGHGGPGRSGGPDGPRGPGGPGRLGDVATFLGLQPADLAASLQSGKTLAQIVQEKGKTANDLKTYLTTQERTRLAQAVTDGKLTQAQADQRLADLPSRLDQLINRTGSAGGPFGPGPRGERGPGRGPGGAPGTPTARQ